MLHITFFITAAGNSAIKEKNYLKKLSYETIQHVCKESVRITIYLLMRRKFVVELVNVTCFINLMGF
jgi:hypothetical protein